jgi:hypothetical protein
MGNSNIILPQKIYLSDFGGDYRKFIDTIYAVFYRDFIKHKSKFGSHILGLKFNPIYQDRAYTFYHMTHEGKVEDDRTPDLRRCECMTWARPVIENTEKWNLKFWRQERRGKQRICILVENSNDVDYVVILDVRSTYILLWTAYVVEYKNDKQKKEKEYQNWIFENNGKKYSPDTLVFEIMEELKNKQGSPIA